MGGIRVSGSEEIMKRMQELGEKAGRAMHVAADAGAEIVRDDAARHTPRSKLRKPHMADNIKIRKASMKKDGSVTAKVYVPNKRFGYANPVEYGHIVRTKKGYRLVPAQPFMGPAKESNAAAVKDKIAAVLKGELF